MDTDPRTENETHVGEAKTATVLLGRLMWMLFGPVILAYTIYIIVSRGEGWLTPWDAVFVIVAALMIGGRWIEQRSGTAMTATGERATPEDFARYVRILLPAAIGVWIVANVVGNHLLT